MAVSSGYRDFVLDLLAPLAPVARRMFGGVGLFHNGVMFGLLSRDAFYLRVDERTRPRFEDAGSGPFTYLRAGREVSLSAYYLVPADLLEQQEMLLAWARDAVAVARSAKRG